MESPPGAECTIDGSLYLYFGGTSYLGLHGHPDVIAAACEATRRYGIHSATSRSLYGNTPVLLAVERLAAQFFDLESSFYFVSGYLSNALLVQTLAPDFDILFLDESAHYSVVEAAQAVRLPLVRFRPRDAEDLQRGLQQHLGPNQRPLVLTDGVSSSLGCVAPIDRYCRILEQYDGAAILVDDAHGMGTIGERGRGTLDYLGLWSGAVNDDREAADRPRVRLYVGGTLSKALGGFGGIVPGSAALLRRVRTATHYYQGASAPATPVAAASACALELVQRHPELRLRLRDNVRAVRGGLRQLGLSVDESPTPIVPVQAGTAEQMQRLQEELQERGIIVPYMATYSGLGAAGALRVAVFATHTDEMIQRLLDTFRSLL
jgi:7-keto-8-aminopelargonate synthetase-like enzyme